MTIKPIDLLGILVAIALWFPAVAGADDFTFVVPVQLNNMHPEITQGRVKCTVGQVLSNFRLNPQTGSESTAFRITAGRYHGDVTVVINAGNERSRAASFSWGCTLELKTDADRGWSPASQFAGPFERYPRDTSAPYRDLDEGTLPY